MEQHNSRRSHLISVFFFFFFHSSALIHCFTNTFDESLDAVLHDHAFRVMIHHRPHTGALYNATPPAKLAGIKLSVLGLRTRTLYQKGANFSNFVIPPKTVPVPYVKRLAIVYHNLGNWSSLYYALSGYTLITPVVGFVAYDATRLSGKNLSRIELNMMGNMISVQFTNSIVGGSDREAKCAEFGGDGEVSLSEMRGTNVCYSRNQGHFTVVVPIERKKKEKLWGFWIVGCLVGVVMVVGLGVVIVVRLLVGKRAEGLMEKEADEGECLGTDWIGGSKMPRAEVTRTQPVIESTVLPNPKLSWYA